MAFSSLPVQCMELLRSAEPAGVLCAWRRVYVEGGGSAWGVESEGTNEGETESLMSPIYAGFHAWTYVRPLRGSQEGALGGGEAPQAVWPQAKPVPPSPHLQLRGSGRSGGITVCASGLRTKNNHTGNNKSN